MNTSSVTLNRKGRKVVDDAILKAIESKLDLVVRLLAARAIEKASKKESILALGLAGFDRNKIAELVKTTPLTVSVVVSDSKKSTKGKKRKSKPQKSRI